MVREIISQKQNKEWVLDMAATVGQRFGIDILKDPSLTADQIRVTQNVVNVVENRLEHAGSNDAKPKFINELVGEAHFRFVLGGAEYYIFTSLNDGYNGEIQKVMAVRGKEEKEVEDPELKTILQLYYIRELLIGSGLKNLTEEQRIRLINKLLDFVVPIERVETNKDVKEILRYIQQIYGEDFSSIGGRATDDQLPSEVETTDSVFSDNLYTIFYSISDGGVNFMIRWDLNLDDLNKSNSPKVIYNYSFDGISPYDIYLLAFRRSIVRMLKDGFTVSRIVDLFDIMVYRYRKEEKLLV